MDVIVSDYHFNNNLRINYVFNKAYSFIENFINFNPEWKIGDDFNDKINLVNLEPGEFAKSFCVDTNQKIIFLGTRLGTVVIFERYSSGRDGVFETKMPDKIVQLQLRRIPNGKLSLRQLYEILGVWFDFPCRGKIIKYRGDNNLSVYFKLANNGI